jgi:hypothetical protein
MNETIAKYEAADPALGGDVKTLNIASLYNSSCVGECSWTRTFKSVADLPATYTVSAPDWVTVTPASLTINPGAIASDYHHRAMCGLLTRRMGVRQY